MSLLPKRRLALPAAAIGLAAAVSPGLASLAVQLSVGNTENLTTTGYLQTYGHAATSAGVTVGYGMVPNQSGGGMVPLRYTSSGGLLPLPLPADATSPNGRNRQAVAMDIAEDGTIVGYAVRYPTGSTPGQYGALWWDATGAYHELAPGGTKNNGTSYAQAWAISPAGTFIVGDSWFSGAGNNPARWIKTGGLPVKMTTGGYSGAYPAAVNDAGIVVGHVFDPARGNKRRPSRWSDDGTSVTALADFVPGGASGPTYDDGWAVAITSDGTIYGHQTVDADGVGPAPSRTHALRWSPLGAVSEITPAGAFSSVVYAANEQGMVLLSSCDSSGTCQLGILLGGVLHPLSDGKAKGSNGLSEVVNGQAFVAGYTGSPFAIARWGLTLSATNEAPTVSFATNPVSAYEGTGIALTASVSDPDGPSPLSYAWDLTDDGVDDFTTTTTTPSYTLLATDDGTRVLRMHATDGAGAVSAPASLTVNVANVAPTATFSASPRTVLEGSPFILSLGSPSDPSVVDAAAGFGYAFDCGAGTGLGIYSALTMDTPVARSCGTSDDGPRAVQGAIRDKDGGATTYGPTAVTVVNVAPTVTALALPSAPVAVNTPVTATALYTDPGTADTHGARFTWDWDLATNAAVAGAAISSVAGNSGSASGTTSFAAPGVYTVQVAVTDDDGGSGTRVSTADIPAYIVVYDPSAGFVTGGGWILSPAGACLLSSCTGSTEGKATFGFVSRYAKGATTPSGNTEFHFHAGGLSFRSTSYHWLVVTSTRAQYKGRGSINGAGEYGFLITAIDGQTAGRSGPDAFRIKIWSINSDGTDGNVVYDNKLNEPDDSSAATTLGGGSITIQAR